MIKVFPDVRGMVYQGPLPVRSQITASFDLGDGMVGLPLNLDTCIRMTRLGEQAPSPIEFDYRWPREVSTVPEVMAHQRTTASRMTTNPRFYVLNGIGTGKTLTSLWASDYLITAGAVRRVLVVSTKSTLECVWGDSLFMHMPHRSFAILHGDRARRLKRLAEPKDYYILNYDGLVVISEALNARHDIDLIIFDEIGELANSQTNAWKAAHMLINRREHSIPWVWGMTATPIPNSPEDAYGQMRLVTPERVPRYFTQWRNIVMERQSQYVWTPRREANTIVFNAMQPAVRFKREECVDLPPAIFQTRECELSADQQKHYKDIMRELHTEIDGKKITALNEGIKMSKLVQVSAGVAYDNQGREVEVDAGPRLKVLMEIIDQVGEKVIIFVPFTSVTNMLRRELSKYWRVEVVTGATPDHERTRIFREFQDPDTDLDLIAHPECMSHGLTLTQASTVIWYAPINSNKIYEQACGRITRIGQRYTANIINLSATPVERRIYKRLETRQALQGLLLDMIEKGEA